MARESPDGMRWVDGPRPVGTELNDAAVLVDGVDRGVVVGPDSEDKYRVRIDGRDHFIFGDKLRVIHDEREVPQRAELAFSQVLREGREWTWYAGRPAVVDADGWIWLLKNDQCPCGEGCDECEFVHINGTPFRRKLTKEDVLRNILERLAQLDAELEHAPGAGGDWRRRNDLVHQVVKMAHQVWGAPRNGKSDVAGYDLDPDAPEGYQMVAYLALPTGQVSWHLPATGQILRILRGMHQARLGQRGVGAFFVPEWDGHTRADKAQRIADFL